MGFACSRVQTRGGRGSNLYLIKDKDKDNDDIIYVPGSKSEEAEGGSNLCFCLQRISCTWQAQGVEEVSGHHPLPENVSLKCLSSYFFGHLIPLFWITSYTIFFCTLKCSVPRPTHRYPIHPLIAPRCYIHLRYAIFNVWRYSNYFNWTMTYRLKSDIPIIYGWLSLKVTNHQLIWPEPEEDKSINRS